MERAGFEPAALEGFVAEAKIRGWNYGQLIAMKNDECFGSLDVDQQAWLNDRIALQNLGLQSAGDAAMDNFSNAVRDMAVPDQAAAGAVSIRLTDKRMSHHFNGKERIMYAYRSKFACAVRFLVLAGSAILFGTGASADPTRPDVANVPAQPPAYTLEQYAPYAGNGGITLSGRLIIPNVEQFGTQAWGDVEVYAIPETPYNLWYVRRLAFCMTDECGQKDIPFDRSLNVYDHIARTDANGYFTLTGLHQARYILLSSLDRFYSGQDMITHDRKDVITPEGEVVNVPDPHVVNDGGEIFVMAATDLLVKPNATVGTFNVLNQRNGAT